MATEPFIGEIAIFPYNFTPRGWLPCNGQLVSVMDFQSLFALLGTTYGGDGRNTFGVPNLTGRSVVGSGKNHTRTYCNGEAGGNETIKLTSANMPPHAHAIGVQCQSSLEASTQDGTKAAPAPDVILAKDKDSTGGVHPVLPYAEGSKKNTTIGGLKVNATASCQDTGLGEAAEIRNPYQVLSYCIATEGIFPSRS
jgi:microcystin-dependent protein